eukprot:3097971-Amphidinium_carterae.2
MARAVCQGEPFSPVVYAFLNDAMLKALKRALTHFQCREDMCWRQLDSGRTIVCCIARLAYADDTYLVASSAPALQYNCSRASLRSCLKLGLISINAELLVKHCAMSHDVVPTFAFMLPLFRVYLSPSCCCCSAFTC